MGAVEAYWWAARPLWALILGGVFERHPTLRYVLAENGAWCVYVNTDDQA